MQAFFSNIFSEIGVRDIIDILITAFIIYKLLGFIRETRAQQLVKGLLLLMLAYLLSDFLEFNTIHWILKGVFTFGLFAIVVIFQPELRRGLEFMGRSKLGINSMRGLDYDHAVHVVSEIRNAVSAFSETETGALLVFEREITLEDIVETGTVINADISQQLLGNIFYEGAPLHDGAVLIRGDEIYAAGCVLPLTSDKDLNKDLGTRHRAGIGITENSDALVIIVSEETGIISVAEDGKLTRFLDEDKVDQVLRGIYIDEEQEEKSFLFSKFLERLGLGGKKHGEK